MTTEAGIMPIAMTADPSRRVNYASVVIEITPEEFERLKSGELQLPQGWRVADELFATTRAAGAAS